MKIFRTAFFASQREQCTNTNPLLCNICMDWDLIGIVFEAQFIYLSCISKISKMSTKKDVTMFRFVKKKRRPASICVAEQAFTMTLR